MFYLQKFMHMVAHKGTTMVGLPLDVQSVQALRQGLEEDPISRLKLLFQQCLVDVYLSGLMMAK